MPADSEASDFDIDPEEVQQNIAAADQFLQDLEWLEEDMAQPPDHDDLSWKEPRKRSARWFAIRKDQPVYKGMAQPNHGLLTL